MKIKKHRNNLFVIIFAFLILVLGIGYAVLTERLQIGSSINYDSMKWDVHFTDVTDYSEEYMEYNKIKYPTMDMNEYIYTAPAVVEVSEDKKGISFSCDIGNSTKMIMCIAVATIKNDSTFAAEIDKVTVLSDEPEKFEQYTQLLNSAINTEWFTSLDDKVDVEEGDVLNPGETRNVAISYSSSSMTQEVLEQISGIKLNFDIYIDWVEKEVTE